MLKIILIVLLVVIVVLVVVISLRPSKFVITRSTTIAAPPSVVFAQVNDLHKFQDWSPWAKIDPACKTTFDGPPAGIGAAFAWNGNKEVGEGRMTITDSRPGELVSMKLDFKKPFAATNYADFVFKPDGNQTTVTWSMNGTNNCLFKIVGLFMNMDKMVGTQFEQGLASMKTISEAAAKP